MLLTGFGSHYVVRVWTPTARGSSGKQRKGYYGNALLFVYLSVLV